MNAVIVALAIIGKALINAAFLVVYNYTAEIQPTVVRSAGTGLCSMVARIGSIAAPQIHLLVKKKKKKFSLK